MPAARVYFAAKSRTEIGSALVGRLELLNKGAADGLDNSAEYANAIRHYYGKETGFGLTWGIKRAGKSGELAQFRINRARAYAKALVSIVTQAKVQWRPQAKNGDAGVAAATTLSTDILADAWKTKKMSRVWLRWVEQALVLSQAFAFDEWDPGAGPPLMAMGQTIKKQGDIVVHNVLPWDVKVDPACTSYEETTWRFVRLWKNRWDLAKLYTRLADGRTGAEAEDAILSAQASAASNDLDPNRATEQESDLIPVWYFFHDKTPAMPAGRETVFITGDCVLRDSRLLYAATPVHRMAADDMFGTPHGWTSFWDTLGIQEISDAVHTTLATTITTLGNPTLALEQGSDIKAEDVVAGFQVVRYPRQGSKPEFLRPVEFPPQALEYDAELDQQQKSILGLNDTALGRPQGKELNAQAFAVLASMAVQQASPFQTTATDSLASLGTSYLNTYKRRVTRERELKVTGKASKNLYSVQKFSGKDLAAIDGVNVDIGNPLEQTAQGRATILQNLMEIPGAVTTAEAMFEVIDTGRLEPAIRGQRDELLLLKAEFEMLQQGKIPVMHDSQNHALHYRENYGPLQNLDALENPEIIKAVEAHRQAHYLQMYGVPREGDPLRYTRECFLMGRQPDPSLMPPPMGFMPPPGMPMGGPPGMGPPPGPGGPGDGPPPPGGPGQPPPMPPPPEAQGGPLDTAPVHLPTNPLTGQQFDSATGGGVAQPA